MDNPLIQGAMAILAGNFIGTISDRIVTIIDARLRLVESLNLGSSTTSLLDSILGVFLHMGFITLGTRFASEAMPWLTEEPGALMVFSFGLQATSSHLFSHIQILNQLLFDDKLYSKEVAIANKKIEVGPASIPLDSPGAGSSSS
jgi:hypothetical protein